MKKASVTIPVVVAVIVLGIIVLLVFSVQNQGFFRNDKILFSNSKTIPIDNLIQSCLYDSLQTAFIKVGNSGGWLTGEIFETNPEEPTNSYALPVNQNEHVAYWYFMIDNNFCEENCRFGSLAPTLSQIEQQIEDYVALNVFKCFTNNWVDDGTYNIYIRDLPTADVILTDKNVKANLKFPIDVEKIGEGSITHRDEYSATLNLPFKKIWQVATEIAGYEAKSRFLEMSVLDILSIYSGKDADKLPPMYDVSFFDYSPVMWEADDVREKISEILTIYMNQITVNHSKNFDFGIKTSGERKALQGFLVWDLKDKNVQDLNISFIYNPKWKPFIAFGNQEGVILPENLAPNDQDLLFSILGIAGMNRYKTTYQISYPLLVEIKDDEALNGEGYTFRIALEGNIRNNQVLQENEDDNSIETMSESNEITGVCDKRFWGNEFKIKVVDYFGNPLENVPISLYALNSICGLGRTNMGGELVTPLPEGIFTIKAHSYGYYIPQETISSRTSEVTTLTAYPEKEIKVKIGKSALIFSDVDMGRIKWGLDVFDKKEKGVFIMYNIDNPKYVVSLKINGSASPDSLEKVANIVPGRYKLIAVVLYNDTITIPGKCILGIEPFCLNRMESAELTNYPVSLIISDNIEIKSEELYNNNMVEISIPVLPTPTNYDTLNKVMDLKNILSKNAVKMRFRSE